MISNASPLITIAKLGILKELLVLYKNIEITEEVYSETIIKGLEKNKPDAILLNALKQEGKIKIISLDKKHTNISKKIEKNYKIDKGESETIALALQLKQNSLIMDESLGRKVSKLFEIKPKGSLRIILELYESKIIDEVKLKTLVNILIGSQFRLDSEIIGRFWELFEKLKKKKQS